MRALRQCTLRISCSVQNIRIKDYRNTRLHSQAAEQTELYDNLADMVDSADESNGKQRSLFSLQTDVGGIGGIENNRFFYMLTYGIL